VLRWQLHNPGRRNAVSPQMLRWIAQRCATLAGEIVVLHGDAEGFCSGFDLGALAASEHENEATPDASLIEATEAMHRADATFVASVHGHAIGAGVELACTCDFRIASTSASFHVPAGRLCVVYHAGGLMQMHAVFGTMLTRRLVLAGQPVGAEQAERAGALHACVAPDRLDDAVEQLCTALHQQAAPSVRGNRALLRALDRRALPDDLLAAHARARSQAYASPEHARARESVRAATKR
jgi:enoyl-CoA hydratase/carnithine racemase